MSTVVVVTATGDSTVSARMIGSGSPTTLEPKCLGWGLGGIAGGPFTAAKSDVAPFAEAPEARITGSSAQATTTYTDDTYQVTGTITCTQGGGETIAEVFLSDATTKPFSTTVASPPSGSGGTSMTVAASYTPANNTYIQVRTEVLKVTAGTGTTSLTVARGQNGSTAISTIAIGDEVTLGNVPPAATSGTAGNLFLHASFTGLPLSNGDSLASTVSVAFN